MDLNAGLTQALSDGTNNYIYGLGRIAPVNGNGTEYFLDDALSSVRQLADANGDATYSRAYAIGKELQVLEQGLLATRKTTRLSCQYFK